MWATISSIFNLFGSALGLVKQRDAELNAPAVVAAQVRQDQQDVKEKITDDIKSQDSKGIANDIS